MSTFFFEALLDELGRRCFWPFGNASLPSFANSACHSASKGNVQIARHESKNLGGTQFRNLVMVLKLDCNIWVMDSSSSLLSAHASIRLVVSSLQLGWELLDFELYAKVWTDLVNFPKN